MRPTTLNDVVCLGSLMTVDNVENRSAICPGCNHRVRTHGSVLIRHWRPIPPKYSGRHENRHKKQV